MRYNFTVPQEYCGWALKDFLKSRGVSSAAIRAVKLLPNGILQNGEKANTNVKINTGDIISVLAPSEAETSVIPQDIPLEIAYESEHAMVINKPAGIPVHPTRGHVSGTLANAFCGLMRQRGTQMPFRAINRIDKNTSGLVLLAMNAFAAPFLAKSVQKEYIAIIHGEMPLGKGVINAPIARCSSSIITREVSPSGKCAITEYNVIKAGGGVSLISANLVTGRTHQIRVHFSHIGHPLCGDDMYGGNLAHINRHALHCSKLQFLEPLHNLPTYCNCDLPSDMCNILKKCNLF